MDRQCPVCGAPLPPEGVERCPVCGTTLQVPEQDAIPFDNPARAGFFPALWQTWRDACFSPNTFFARIPTSQEVRWPLLYALIFWLINAAFNAIYQPLLARLMTAMPHRMRIPAEFFRTSPEGILFSFLSGPMLVLFTAVLMAAVLHALLFLVGGAQPDFTRSLRTVCYTFGVYMLALAPFLGWFVMPWWWVALLVVGLARAHGTETWRSAFAVLLPAITCCGISLALMVLAASYFMRGVSHIGAA